ncbi:MAG TPA: biopolymer transporter ExbD [Armatimonadota bacterium]|nr:biopolymer transporter ExbD [Armatimonadota bacterium]
MIRTRRTGQSKQISGINITPLTDVCLVLLIIFMVTASALVNKESGFNLPLPKASKSTVLPSAPLVVRIEQGPKLSLNNKPATFENLGQMIEGYKPQDGNDLSIVIKADENIPYRYVIQTIDIAGKAGVSNTMLATRQPQTGQSANFLAPKGL